MKKIGFIGLGNMGYPMVENLLADDFEVHVFDINKETLKKIEALNAKVVENPEELIDNVDVVFTSLPAEKIVESVYLSETGLLEFKANTKTIMVDTSTVSLTLNTKLNDGKFSNTLTTKLKDGEEKNNLEFLANPVSGGVIGAEQRTLTFMVGGKKAVFDKVEDVLNHLGANIFHVGESIESGTTVKLIN